MSDKNQIPTETHKALQDFAVAYFFVYRIQIENAELVSKSLLVIRPSNGLLTELGYGYINSAVTEFVLSLFDALMLLKKSIKKYEYECGGAIDLIMKFRRHILAHKGCNWGSEESIETLKIFSKGSVFNSCHMAAAEFIQDLQKYMNFKPIDKFPRIQKMKKHDLDNLLKNSPELAFSYSVPTLDEVKCFFGNDLL